MREHSCYACSENNLDRIVTSSGDGWSIEFTDRFVGPPGRAHGGIAIGALTCPALQTAEREGMRNPVVTQVFGRINIPPPLSKAVRCVVKPENDRYHVQLIDDSNVVINGAVKIIDQETRVGSVLQEIPPHITKHAKALSEIAEANIEAFSLASILNEKVREIGLIPFLEESKYKCFGCGETGNSLKLSHKIVRPGDTWTMWEGEELFTDGDNRLAAAIITAALDCANMYTVVADDPEFISKKLTEKKLWVTGQFGVHFLKIPAVKVEGNYRVAAHFLGQEGRKLFSMSVLLDKDGFVYAVGEETVIIIDLPPQLFKNQA
jgi:hypothetical protein